MKRIILILTAVVMFACGGNQSQQQKVENQSATEEGAEATETEVIEAEDCIMEKVITLLPKDVIPQGMRGKDLLTEMKKRSEGPDGSYDILCDYAYYDIFYGECNSEAIEIRSFKRENGSHLVLFSATGGCDCNVTLSRQAFDYRNGELTKTDWPFEEPKFDEFFNAISLMNASANNIEYAKNDGRVMYLLNYGNGGEVVVGAMWSTCDMYEFIEFGRIIEYRWNGTSFDKSYGPYKMFSYGEKNFGGLRLGDTMPKKLDGFKLQGAGNGVMEIYDSKTNEVIADFYYDEGSEKINWINVYSSDYASIDGTHPGTTITELLDRSAKSKGYRLDGQVYVQTYQGVYAFDENMFEIDNSRVASDGSFDLVKYALSAPVKAIVVSNTFPSLN